MWSEGILTETDSKNKYKYWCKHFDKPSDFGLEKGKISKPTIRKVGETKDVYNFDRGLDIPTKNAEVEAILNMIIAKYN